MFILIIHQINKIYYHINDCAFSPNRCFLHEKPYFYMFLCYLKKTTVDLITLIKMKKQKQKTKTFVSK